MGSKRAIVTKIRKFNAGLDPERLNRKFKAMRADAFVFFRGTCHLFYDRLPELGPLVRSPAAWSCGDLHLENFGSFRGDNGLVYFDLNDFDEAVLAPCVWDLIRVVASIIVARKTLNMTRQQAMQHGADLIEAYAEALAHGKARWFERDVTGGIIGKVLKQLDGRSRKELLDRRTVRTGNKRKLIIDGEHALKASPEQRAFVTKLIKQFAQTRPNPHFFKPLDIARRVAGTGSLGLERYVILVAGKGGVDHAHLLDLKHARGSSSVKHLALKQPSWPCEAERVIAVQTRCQAISPAFLAAIEADHCSFVLRDLQPIEDRLDLAHIASEPKGFATAFCMMGSLLAWNQLRSSGRQRAAIADDLISFGAKAKWQRRVLEIAAEAADRSWSDWKIYGKAFDEGLFSQSQR